MKKEYIVIRGAKEHNLKNLNLKIPRNKLVIITGLSGSGKSSLAFDTIYAEGQRRYVESLSAYARQFLEQMQKPDVDYIEGLSPSISIEQRRAGSNPRSTVATATEIYDYLRLLFSKIGHPHCYKCGRSIQRQTVQEITDRVLSLPAGTKLIVLSPLVRSRKGSYQALFEKISKEGFVRVRVDGKVYNLSEKINLDKRKKHNISVIVDRLVNKPEIRTRLADSIETSVRLSGGLVLVNDMLFSELYACPNCTISYEELTPRMFSFNSPYGACKKCHGLGTRMEIDKDLVMPDKNKSISEGAILAWRKGGKRILIYYYHLLRASARHYNFSLDTPFKRLSKSLQDIILYGSEDYIYGRPFEGVIPNLERRLKETASDYVRDEISKYMSVLACPACKGARLRPETLAVSVGDISIYELTKMSVSRAKDFFANLKLSPKERLVARQILKEIGERLNFLSNVGLDYLTLDRTSGTLSGGEAQRIRLATQIGARLTGVIYVLDEPSIGLHQRDNAKL